MRGRMSISHDSAKKGQTLMSLNVHRVLWRLIVFPFLASLCCGANDYSNAISNQNVYPKPPLPVSGPGSPGFGPAGTIFQDPTFGSNIVRVTDGNTQPQVVSGSFYTNSAAYQNVWANDDRAFILLNDWGPVLFSFDPVNFKATSLGWLGLAGAIFGFQNPHVAYGIAGSDGRTITSYDYTTRVYTPILDLNSVISFQQYVGAFSISYDDDHFAVAFGGEQDTHPYVLFYQRSTGIQHLLDLSHSTIDGQPTNIRQNHSAHMAAITRRHCG